MKEDTIFEKIQELNRQIKALLDNQYINAVEGLEDELKAVQVKFISYLNEQGGKIDLSEQIIIMRDIQDELKYLESLHSTVAKLKSEYEY